MLSTGPRTAEVSAVMLPLASSMPYSTSISGFVPSPPQAAQFDAAGCPWSAMVTSKVSACEWALLVVRTLVHPVKTVPLSLTTAIGWRAVPPVGGTEGVTVGAVIAVVTSGERARSDMRSTSF
jgi:hypothetical protein